MDSDNPYAPPQESVRLPSRGKPSPWSGPLLTVSTFAFILAFAASAATVVPELTWIQNVIVVALAGLGVVSLVGSFLLHRRGRKSSRGRVDSS